MSFFAIIPARYASTRFPGKPLTFIKGQSMINRVYHQVVKSKLVSNVAVATDDKRIFDHVKEFGNVVYTSENHKSGTDRCFEAAQILYEKWNIKKNDVILNVQGDEPFIDPLQIDGLCKCFDNKEVKIATLIKKLDNPEVISDPNIVKVVISKTGYALYFSRLPVPYLRKRENALKAKSPVYYKHIGLYSYKFETLSQITSLGQSELEVSESLEQLRWLENDYRIFTKETFQESVSVDTPEDIQKFS